MQVKQGEIAMDVMLNFGEPYLNPDNAVHFHRSLTFLHSDDDYTTVNSTLMLRVSTPILLLWFYSCVINFAALKQ